MLSTQDVAWGSGMFSTKRLRLALEDQLDIEEEEDDEVGDMFPSYDVAMGRRRVGRLKFSLVEFLAVCFP